MESDAAPPPANRLLPALALAGAAAAWGSTFVVNKVALEEVGAFTILAVRFPLALAVLVPLALRAEIGFAGLLRPRLVLCGVMLAVHFGLQTSGLAYTTASRGALIVAGVPVVTALAAALLLGERLNRYLVVGITLSVVGVAVLIGSPGSLATRGLLVGDLLVAVSVVAWAIYTVQARQLAARFTTLETTVAATAAAIPLLIGGAAVEWYNAEALTMTARSGALMLYLGLVPSAAAFLAWNWGLRHVDASRAGPFINLVPVTGVLFAVLLGEALTMAEITGAAIIAAGLLIAYRRGRADPVPTRVATVQPPSDT